MDRLVDRINSPFKFKVLVSVMMAVLILLGLWVFWMGPMLLRDEEQREHKERMKYA